MSGRRPAEPGTPTAEATRADLFEVVELAGDDIVPAHVFAEAGRPVLLIDNRKRYSAPPQRPRRDVAVIATQWRVAAAHRLRWDVPAWAQTPAPLTTADRRVLLVTGAAGTADGLAPDRDVAAVVDRCGEHGLLPTVCPAGAVDQFVDAAPSIAILLDGCGISADLAVALGHLPVTDRAPVCIDWRLVPTVTVRRFGQHRTVDLDDVLADADLATWVHHGAQHDLATRLLPTDDEAIATASRHLGLLARARALLSSRVWDVLDPQQIDDEVRRLESLASTPSWWETDAPPHPGDAPSSHQ